MSKSWRKPKRFTGKVYFTIQVDEEKRDLLYTIIEGNETSAFKRALTVGNDRFLNEIVNSDNVMKCSCYNCVVYDITGLYPDWTTVQLLLNSKCQSGLN